MLAALALSLALSACVQEVAREATAEELLAPWHGIWRGELELWQRDGVARRVPMELHVRPRAAGEWTWTIVYGAGAAREERRYALRAKAGVAFEIDEQNGIVLPLQRFGRRFFSCFSVGGSELLARYELVGEGALLYEMISSGGAGARKTGGEGAAPEVGVVPVNAFQRALLQRAKEEAPPPKESEPFEGTAEKKR
jgi:hypothetical protein